MRITEASTTNDAVKVELVALDPSEEISERAVADGLFVLVDGKVGISVGGRASEVISRSSAVLSDPWIVSVRLGDDVRVSAISPSSFAMVYRLDGHQFLRDSIPLASYAIPLRRRGSGYDERGVRDFGEYFGIRMPLGETVCDGAWSTYPPHKHDENVPGVEAAVQEVLAFQLRPRSGFGVYLNYPHADGITAAATQIIEDGSVVACADGYHSVVVASGYTMYYLWAGDGTSDDITNRPDSRFRDLDMKGAA